MKSFNQSINLCSSHGGGGVCLLGRRLGRRLCLLGRRRRRGGLFGLGGGRGLLLLHDAGRLGGSLGHASGCRLGGDFRLLDDGGGLRGGFIQVSRRLMQKDCGGGGWRGGGGDRDIPLRGSS